MDEITRLKRLIEHGQLFRDGQWKVINDCKDSDEYISLTKKIKELEREECKHD